MSAEQPNPPGGRRVHWLELFFDLVMVACIGQIAHTMHGDPDWAAAAVFTLLLAAVWWAWVNATITMNLFGARVTSMIWTAVILAMAAMGLMAAAAPEALGDRAAAFAIGNAAIRAIWMVPWFVKRRITGLPWWRPVAYNIVPIGLWLVSIAVPQPWQVLLWVLAVAIEVALLGRVGDHGWVRDSIDVDHAVERVGLLVVIVFGESILSIIDELSEHWSVVAGVTAALAFASVALLAWIFFGFATRAVERGLHRLQSRGNVSGLRDAVMYLPFLLIAGITLFAAGLGTAVAEGERELPLGAAVCLAGGVSLFFLASTAESLRYGAPWRDIVLWGPAGILLPWILVPLRGAIGAVGLVGVALLVIAVLATLNAVNARRVHAARSKTADRAGGGT
ncbi:low temperature requirement protein A [Microbacterium sp. 4R-513]|uniref:low temperature requirement protein A n=1 Tax=Microbacterium sp. 4R-513 TaxID=2567934 RepID=UPI0013E15A90|nr:low temperature requirement protein A [Microbacterium sp. 4R-513]QIG40735.1 low temperature requirement protein A [Microbacterium sp. 4R-513]